MALALTADDAIDERELGLLDQLDACARMGLPGWVFEQIAKGLHGQLQGRFIDKPWLSLADTELLDELLDPVRSRDKRLLVCRLVAGVITADGEVCSAERLVYEHMLMRWKFTRAEIAAAIRAMPVPTAAMPLQG